MKSVTLNLDGTADTQAEEHFWGFTDDRTTLEVREGPEKRQFDLAERTAVFGEAVIAFAKRVPQNPVNNRLIDQLVGAGTSVGANYCEADDGATMRDFKHKICLCRKEARETKFFLRMIAKAEPSLKAEARVLWQEAKELHLIFSAIWRKSVV
ncbi:MAG TPA: four helix bundle protein [Methylomirabilota bacterium]|jgi:four helix bundle protein|nr:four helix bundle protein [Methylomirabilota bacterium]